jgi:CheY-like chemotaxis protein
MSKIMIVDDEDNVRYVVKRMLEEDGHEVLEASNGNECLEKLEEERPDLILLDVMMPGLDGWEVCKRIKEDEKTKDITVAMLTVKSQNEDKITSFDDAGADWHINKPFKEERLIRTVNWLLESPLKR